LADEGGGVDCGVASGVGGNIGGFCEAAFGAGEGVCGGVYRELLVLVLRVLRSSWVLLMTECF